VKERRLNVEYGPGRAYPPAFGSTAVPQSDKQFALELGERASWLEFGGAETKVQPGFSSDP
jgi:hypothetical protein